MLTIQRFDKDPPITFYSMDEYRIPRRTVWHGIRNPGKYPSRYFGRYSHNSVEYATDGYLILPFIKKDGNIPFNQYLSDWHDRCHPIKLLNAVPFCFQDNGWKTSEKKHRPDLVWLHVPSQAAVFAIVGEYFILSMNRLINPRWFIEDTEETRVNDRANTKYVVALSDDRKQSKMLSLREDPLEPVITMLTSGDKI